LVVGVGFCLDEISVVLGAEGGTECDDERRETLDRFVVQEEINRTEHGTAEGDVGEDGAHHGFHQIAFERAALKDLAGVPLASPPSARFDRLPHAARGYRLRNLSDVGAVRGGIGFV
jgi:hypothetical protein